MYLDKSFIKPMNQTDSTLSAAIRPLIKATYACENPTGFLVIFQNKKM